MKFKERQKRQAFIDEIHQVEKKHGYRLTVYQPPVQVVPKPFIPVMTQPKSKKSFFEYLKNLKIWQKSRNTAVSDPALAENPK